MNFEAMGAIVTMEETDAPVFVLVDKISWLGEVVITYTLFGTPCEDTLEDPSAQLKPLVCHDKAHEPVYVGDLVEVQGDSYAQQYEVRMDMTCFYLHPSYEARDLDELIVRNRLRKVGTTNPVIDEGES